MEQAYLEQLIAEVKARDGGLILNVNGRPEVVVLSIEKYNQLISNLPLSSGILPSQQFPISASTEQLSESLFYPKTVLLTGGAGYIGGHLARQLINAGHRIVIVDNLSAGKREHVPQGAKFIEGNCGDMNLLRDIFSAEKINAVMHLAASIEVEESVKEPVKYLENNALNTARLLEAMAEAGVNNIIFSSTAAVYGEQAEQPLTESAAINPGSPYGYSKYLAEEFIKFYCKYKNFNGVVLRYFNACGSDFDGKIRATHESHLLAKLMAVVSGKEEQLIIHGNDYSTNDGTCVRDYVHVLDIAAAHILVLDKIEQLNGFHTFNIGAGRGVSVLEMVSAVSEVLNRMIPMQVGARRAGDVAEAVADISKIRANLGFEPKFSDLETIIKTAFRKSQITQ